MEEWLWADTVPWTDRVDEQTHSQGVLTIGGIFTKVVGAWEEKHHTGGWNEPNQLFLVSVSAMTKHPLVRRGRVLLNLLRSLRLILIFRRTRRDFLKDTVLPLLLLLFLRSQLRQPDPVRQSFLSLFSPRHSIHPLPLRYPLQMCDVDPGALNVPSDLIFRGDPVSQPDDQDGQKQDPDLHDERPLAHCFDAFSGFSVRVDVGFDPDDKGDDDEGAEDHYGD